MEETRTKGESKKRGGEEGEGPKRESANIKRHTEEKKNDYEMLRCQKEMTISRNSVRLSSRGS